jgi:hypothetical protein
MRPSFILGWGHHSKDDRCEDNVEPMKVQRTQWRKTRRQGRRLGLQANRNPTHTALWDGMCSMLDREGRFKHRIREITEVSHPVLVASTSTLPSPLAGAKVSKPPGWVG